MKSKPFMIMAGEVELALGLIKENAKIFQESWLQKLLELNNERRIRTRLE